MEDYPATNMLLWYRKTSNYPVLQYDNQPVFGNAWNFSLIKSDKKQKPCFSWTKLYYAFDLFRQKLANQPPQRSLLGPHVPT